MSDDEFQGAVESDLEPVAQVRIKGTEPEMTLVEESLGTDTIYQMAKAAREHDVMITISVSPYETTLVTEDGRDPDD